MFGDTAFFPGSFAVLGDHRLKAEIRPLLDQRLDPGRAHSAITEEILVIPNPAPDQIRMVLETLLPAAGVLRLKKCIEFNQAG